MYQFTIIFNRKNGDYSIYSTKAFSEHAHRSAPTMLMMMRVWFGIVFCCRSEQLFAPTWWLDRKLLFGNLTGFITKDIGCLRNIRCLKNLEILVGANLCFHPLLFLCVFN